MKKFYFYLILIFISFLTFSETYDNYTLCDITVSSKEDIELLYKMRLDIVGRRGDVYRVILKEEEYCILENYGLKIDVLYEEMAKERVEMATPGYCNNTPYPCYYIASKFNLVDPPSGSLMEHLLDLYNSYPDIVRLYDIGDSQDGAYDIIAVKVTDNPDIEENEPEMRLYANIHGDEPSGMMVLCDVLNWILSNYSSDPSAQKLVNDGEMWFIPMGNPYGLMNRTRYNSRGVDLNRNFWGPEGCDDCYPDTTPCTPWTERETQAIRDLTEVMGKIFVTSLSFHSGETCFNAVYNYTSTPTADEPIFFESRSGGPLGEADPSPYGLAQAYMDGCTTSNFWYTNGADWYITYGDTNDWSYNVWSDLDTTLEVTSTKWPDSSLIPTYTAEHRQAVINYLLKTFQGVSGVMKDCQSGLPLNGMVIATCTSSSSAYVSVPHQYKEVFTDPDVGDFHRVLEPGTYSIECYSDGYAPTKIDNVVVNQNETTVIDCNMCKTRLVYSSSLVNDFCNGVEGDGIIDPGEKITLQVSLLNIGYESATNVRALLSTNLPGITILDNFSYFPDAPSGETVSTLAPHFQFLVLESLSCGSEIPLNLLITTDQGEFQSSFSLFVGSQTVPNPTTIWSESFDSMIFPPSNWAIVDVSGTTGNWARATNTVHPSGGGTHSGLGLAYFNSYSATSGHSTRFYTKNGTLIPSSANSASLKFWMYHDNGDQSFNDKIQVQISTNGTTWSNIGSPISRYESTSFWKEHSIDLTPYIGQTIYVGFLGISARGNDCHIDDVSLTYTLAPSCSTTVCENEIPPEIAKGSDFYWVSDQSSQVMFWSEDLTSAGYRVYRGTRDNLPMLLNNDIDFCKHYEGTETSFDVTLDPASSLPDRCFYYIITGFSASGEGSAGYATERERILNSSGSCQ